MSKLTSNEMSESLKDLIDNKQDIEDYSLMTENKTIVGAINEIYGKELIANAIGEPLDRRDTFTEMSSDINGLLNMFKINMMNNGVTVESGDRFKQLIDKIATMTEDGQDKGIKFDIIDGSWSYSFNSYINGTTNINIPLDLDYTPNYVFVYIENGQNGTNNPFRDMFLSNLGEHYPFYGNNQPRFSINNISSNGFNLNFISKGNATSVYNGTVTKIILIGVGEGATQNNGIQFASGTVTSNATLIKYDFFTKSGSNSITNFYEINLPNFSFTPSFIYVTSEVIGDINTDYIYNTLFDYERNCCTVNYSVSGFSTDFNYSSCVVKMKDSNFVDGITLPVSNKNTTYTYYAIGPASSDGNGTQVAKGTITDVLQSSGSTASKTITLDFKPTSLYITGTAGCSYGITPNPMVYLDITNTQNNAVTWRGADLMTVWVNEITGNSFTLNIYGPSGYWYSLSGINWVAIK